MCIVKRVIIKMYNITAILITVKICNIFRPVYVEPSVLEMMRPTSFILLFGLHRLCTAVRPLASPGVMRIPEQT